ncbi:hypothetical protein J1605_017280 [Eschrichtius robustus]|uniref:Uncharacterized protein n=1 Tax=Eschrichtius robustus TaxID=9764 RepID=A0AB34I2C3_ESCRO|nr:hypothetical protein J1605_017280 [Eschrichtius robustus]
MTLATTEPRLAGSASQGGTRPEGAGAEMTRDLGGAPTTAREERTRERRMGLGPACRAPPLGVGEPKAERPEGGGRPSPRPIPGRPSAHLSRERPQEPEPRSSRVAASTIAAILSHRPPTLSSLPVPPPAPPAPPAPARGVQACASGARSRSSGQRFGAAAERRATGVADLVRGRDEVGAMEPQLPG